MKKHKVFGGLLFIELFENVAQSAGFIEYTDCNSAEGLNVKTVLY